MFFLEKISQLNLTTGVIYGVITNFGCELKVNTVTYMERFPIGFFSVISCCFQEFLARLISDMFSLEHP